MRPMFDYRICFTKDQNLKYLSHLDLIRTIERVIRRAQLPLVYSEGFHPHPKLSFGPALAVGINSIEEYFDLQITNDFQPLELIGRLNQAAPQGLKMIAAARITQQVKTLNAIINRAAYLMILQTEVSARTAVVAWLEQLINATELNIQRSGKDGQKIVNIRPWLHNLKTELIELDQIGVEVYGETGSGGNLRPEELLIGSPHPAKVLKLTRTGLWHEADGLITKPLDFCKGPEGI